MRESERVPVFYSEKNSKFQLREFFSKMDAKGCVPVTEWVSGSGRFTKPKTLPPFVERFVRKEYKGNLPRHDTPERTAYEFFNAIRRAATSSE